ncbi:MAG: hypothetical protein V1755_11720 [Chloroflexota bacterium]
MTTSREFYRRHLPHWQPQDAIFFITFRLKGTLPQSARPSDGTKTRPDLRRAQMLGGRQPETVDYLDAKGDFVQWDTRVLGAAAGPRWLLTPEVAEIVVEALHHRDGREHRLYAFCVMPNHVHAVFGGLRTQNENAGALSQVLQSLKRHTARHANLVLGRDGPFWQDESYDHVIRDSDEPQRTVSYVLENPVKAGLVSKWQQWRWSYSRPDPVK